MTDGKSSNCVVGKTKTQNDTANSAYLLVPIIYIFERIRAKYGGIVCIKYILCIRLIKKIFYGAEMALFHLNS